MISKLIRYVKNMIKTTLLRRFYNPFFSRAINQNQIIVYMADGKMLHGGLSDRLCGLVSTYCYCMEHNKIFKAYFVDPYKLESFLLPNKYNSLVEEKDISYNFFDSKPIYISYESDNRLQQKKANRKLSAEAKQLHVYTNMRYRIDNFSENFFSLFQLSDKLRQAVDHHLSQLPHEYISITFRFQQLLGDFKEGNFPVLHGKERDDLIKRCLDCILNLKLKNPTIERILVTSDSSTFLTESSKLDCVYTIPGNMVHMDFNKDFVEEDVHMKSFIDLFILAHASRIYIAAFSPLYLTSFPITAAYIANSSWEEIYN